jgi:hypothetical protein
MLWAVVPTRGPLGRLRSSSRPLESRSLSLGAVYLERPAWGLRAGPPSLALEVRWRSG